MSNLTKACVLEVIGLEDPEDLLYRIEHCGRVAYRTWDKEKEGSAEKFVEMIIRLGHESVLEHVNVTAVFQCDRPTAQQLTRHRLASFTMESQRYCNYGNGRFGGDIVLIDPEPKIKDEVVLARYYAGLCKSAVKAQKTYLEMVKSGVAAEDARAVLPNCTACTLAMTANIREWRHIFKIRTDSHAQHNIRKLMNELLGVFKEVVPCLVSDISLIHEAPLGAKPYEAEAELHQVNSSKAEPSEAESSQAIPDETPKFLKF